MSDKQWKEAERRVAAFFATNRRSLSGSNSGEGAGDDARHDTLYIESKYSKYVPIMRLYRECRDSATKESRGRIPVIALQEKHQPGMLLCIHSTDLERLLRVYADCHGFTIVETPNKKAWKRDRKTNTSKDPKYRPKHPKPR